MPETLMKYQLVCLGLFLVIAATMAAGREKHPSVASDTVCGVSNGQRLDLLADKRVVFLGDSITQGGAYVSFTTYFLEKLHPQRDFDIHSLGLASETLSGLSEVGHANGAFPRPCLFERLGRLLERVKPHVVFACYGINDGIYQPLDRERFAAFQNGVKKLIAECQAAGVAHIYLITPPIFDLTPQPGEFNYDSVMTEYAAWEMTLQIPGIQVIDLHSTMRKARDAQAEPFSKDRVHPGEEGHLLIAKVILASVGVEVSDVSLATIKADPLFKLVDQKRRLRSTNWMKHIGYTREATFKPQSLGTVEEDVAKIQDEIDSLRRP
jgi:lysophospholipase L1-like esterase